ncbi:MAG: lipopolysaccharide transport periplasmic protein LptA [Pseudomonadota bacterium]
MKLSLKVSLLLGLSLCCSSGWALSTDRDQPIEIEADFAELDDEEGTTIYIGNVVVIQGSMRMTGDRLRVILSEEREVQDAYMEGRPATFKQTPDNAEHDVEGEALLMEYHALINKIHLIEKAKVTQGARLFQGHRINYDTEKSIITARSASAATPAEDTAPKQRQGRVRIIIPPKKKNP